MSRYFVKRVLLLVVVLFGVTLITFFVSRVLPKNVAWVWAGFQGGKATGDVVADLEREYHLNEPLTIQYVYYLGDLVTGNWGRSPVTKKLVVDDIKAFYPNTVELAVAAALLAIAVGLPVGVLSAIRRNSWIDHVSRLLSLMGVSMPVFWIGILFQMFFYYQLGWFPDPGGRLSEEVIALSPVRQVTGFLLIDTVLTGNGVAFLDALRHMVMPMVALALAQVALISRMTRSCMLEVLGQDYVRTARAKGLAERVVVFVHALRNALLPTITVIGLSFAWLLTGSVVTEVVFYWPGIGRYAVGAVLSFDFPAIMAFTVLAATAFAVINLFTDLAYAFVDPKIRYG